MMQIQFIEANQIRFAYLSQGNGPLVLCLHGFPDTPYTYLKLIHQLSKQGYRVVAPFARGYAPTSIPQDNSYSVIDFGKDALALIEAFGEDKAILIGHDWGALAVYTACQLAPHKIIKAVTAAVPHPNALKVSPAQLRKSWYIFFFQIRFIAEWKLRHNDLAFIDRLWEDWSPFLNPAECSTLIEEVKNSLRNPENTKAALTYYRTIFKAATSKKVFQLFQSPICVPTLTIAGEQDNCVGVENFSTMQKFFTQEFELKTIANAGHFMMHEQPQEFCNLISNFISPTPTQTTPKIEACNTPNQNKEAIK